MEIDGGRLKTLRQRKGLSIRELAQESGISAGAIWRIEAGRRRWAQGKTVRKLADALGVEPHELLIEE